MKFKSTPRRRKGVVELARSERGLSWPENRQAQSRPSPFKLRKILVPTDFSACSKKALAYAVPYARQFGASIILLYVADFQGAGSEISSPGAVALEKRAVASVKKELAELARREIPDAIKTETVVSSGQPFVEIVNLAAVLEVDLIIMATHGVTAPPDFCLGSTAERITRYARCPVLIVRETERDFI